MCAYSKSFSSDSDALLRRMLSIPHAVPCSSLLPVMNLSELGLLLEEPKPKDAR